MTRKNKTKITKGVENFPGVHCDQEDDVMHMQLL